MGISIEDNTHSFIVYTWFEDPPTPADSAARAWRGHITHVASGQKFHFGTLSQVSTFLDLFLQSPLAEDDLDAFRERWRAYVRSESQGGK